MIKLWPSGGARGWNCCLSCRMIGGQNRGDSYLFIYLLTYLFTYLLIYLFTYLLIYLFIYLFIFNPQKSRLLGQSEPCVAKEPLCPGRGS